MKKYYIIVIYPSMYQKEYTLTGCLFCEKGYYKIEDDKNLEHYFPANLTIIEEIKQNIETKN